MEIKVSYEAATTEAGTIASNQEGILGDAPEDATIEESNYNEGRAVYADLKTMSVEYSSILQRDAKNILDIALKLFEVDESVIS